MKHVKYLLPLVSILLPFVGFSQQVKWRAEVSPVESSGYYNIVVDPILIGASNNLSNLRLYSKQADEEREEAYMVQRVTPIDYRAHLEPYKLVSNSAEDSLNSFILDTRAYADKAASLAILIEPADAELDVMVRASDDMKKWFLVKRWSRVAKYAYHREGDKGDLIRLDYVLRGNFNYFEIKLNNHQNDPLKVIKVGKFSSTSSFGELQKVDLGIPKKLVDSLNNTVISFPNLHTSYELNKLVIKSPAKYNYLRQGRVMGKRGTYTHFELNSKGGNEFYFDTLKVDSISSIQIVNGDNPALEISTIEAYGLKRYICAYLEAGVQYSLVVDSKITRRGNYDLSNFSEEMTLNMPIISTTNRTKEVIEPVKREQLFLEKPIVMWGIIVVVGLMLLYIVFSMVKKLKL